MFYFWGEPSLSGFEVSTEAHVNRFMEYVPVGITDLSIKDDTVAFLTQDGQVTVVSYYGQSKNKNKKKKKKRNKQTEGDTQSPYKQLTLNSTKVAFLSSGKQRVVLVSDMETVLEWKRSHQSNNPRVLNNIPKNQVRQVACGNDHSLLLTKDGKLFTWGENSRGQLGLGKGKPSYLSPQPLKSLCGVPLAQISAGGDHSFALSLSGAVFGWGKNSSGQLGQGNKIDRDVPTCVKSLNQKKTVFIACGENHTAILTKGGVVFTFGSGSYGKLGHNSLRDEVRPRLLGGLWGLSVSQIACGRNHTLALVGKEIYSFGRGEQRQQGNGQDTNHFEPQLLCMPPKCNPDQTIGRIIAGGNLSVACYNTTETETISCSPNMNTLKGTLVLNDEIMDRWILECDISGAWNAVQREIQRMFSSASCINGSFINKSNDKHYKTAVGNSGLDLSLARLAFKKLSQKHQILSEVKDVVEKHLIPSLGSTVAGVEAVRIYLILPELLNVLNKQQRGAQLTVALASSILKLDQESLELLMSMWSRLPENYYRTLVRTFHSVSANFIAQMTNDNNWTQLLKPLAVLQKLYSVNKNRLTEGNFYIREITDFFTSNFTNLFTHRNKQLKKFLDLLRDSPFIFDMKTKCAVYTFYLMKNHLMGCNGQTNYLIVNRETVLADTLGYLRRKEYNFDFPIKVRFHLENGMDEGGPCREYFALLGQDTKSFRGIHEFEDSGLFWFSADASATTDDFYYLGVICGIALYNETYINFGFPLALFKKLLNLTPTLSDLAELSPVEARSLRQLLMEDEEEDVEMLDLDFTVKGKELIPNGGKIPVTKTNRKDFVDLYIDFFLNKSVENQFREFKKGFCRGNPCKFWTIFMPEELMLLLYGPYEYDWAMMQKCAEYEQCGPTDELIQNFWMVFFKLFEEQKKKFLCFLYATDRPPLGGLSKLHLKIVKCNFEDADNRYPIAQTCFGVLNLPNYSNIHVLQEKLIHAITYCEVFGLM